MLGFYTRANVPQVAILAPVFILDWWSMVLQVLGYTKLILQIGRGEFEPQGGQTVKDFDVEYYRYKNSLKEDVEKASLIISHAGSGSVLEALGAGKPLLVVINEDLMDNHQLEVANQLYIDGHVFYANTKNLKQTLESEDFSKLKPFPRADPKTFSNFIDSVMGFS
ncbi:UDP-N-acetylglucosamine transferase subunit ALG13 homolog isoform X2 [Liolophura sinensis]|uniref:UDP-N-acetylglucosamine transferase subunit ALG13 homolog isoform X2 n=1 Tax=Liolophura sinensis TaxID=3198878 RepID=UPI003157F470